MYAHNESNQESGASLQMSTTEIVRPHGLLATSARFGIACEGLSEFGHPYRSRRRCRSR
jgi:hypothetical protein